jgi:hypothetical protein
MEGNAIWGRGEPRSVDRTMLVNERSRFDFPTVLRAFIRSRDIGEANRGGRAKRKSGKAGKEEPSP